MAADHVRQLARRDIPSAFAEEVDVIATKHDVNPLLVAALIEVESSGNTFAMRFEPLWYSRLKAISPPKGVTSSTERVQLATSWGLMQVLGVTARELGFRGPFCTALCQPSVGIEFGVRYLKRQLDRYDGNEVEAVAAYNAGTARRVDGGDFSNQSYVNKVWSAYGRVRGDV